MFFFLLHSIVRPVVVIPKSICLLFFIPFVLFSQDKHFEKRVAEIESYKKYHKIVINDANEFREISDSVNLVEVVTYSKRSKKDQSGKVTELTQLPIGDNKRTYYFDERGKLFAIIDEFKANQGVVKRLSYRFRDGALLNVIDEKNKDVTATINRDQLYDWIRRMHGYDVLDGK